MWLILNIWRASLWNRSINSPDLSKNEMEQDSKTYFPQEAQPKTMLLPARQILGLQAAAFRARQRPDSMQRFSASRLAKLGGNPINILSLHFRYSWTTTSCAGMLVSRALDWTCHSSATAPGDWTDTTIMWLSTSPRPMPRPWTATATATPSVTTATTTTSALQSPHRPPTVAATAATSGAPPQSPTAAVAAPATRPAAQAAPNRNATPPWRHLVSGAHTVNPRLELKWA